MLPTIKRLGPACLEVLRPAAGGADFKYLYISDIHLDNPKCKRQLLRRHLDQAVEHNAPIFIFGDFFCAMQGKGDPRGSKGDVLAEHTRTYWNALLDDGYEFLRPYAKHLAVLSDGNHETAVIKHREIDLLELLADRLRREAGSPVEHMGYQGWIRHRYIEKLPPKSKRRGAGCGPAILTHFDHGRGGGGPVTRNVIETNRRLARIQGADVYVYGHVHESWQLKTLQASITPYGRQLHKEQLHLQCATYKEEHTEDGRGFHVERGAPPKPLGGWWVRHRLQINEGARTWRVTAEETF